MVPHLKIASALLAITTFSMSVFIITKGWRRRENSVWALFNISVFVYSLGCYFSEAPITDLYRSYFWWKLSYLGIIFIPTLHYHFTLLFLDIYQKRKIMLWIFYINSFVFLCLNFFTPWFFAIHNMRYVLNRFFIVDGHPVFIFFFIMWMIQIIMAIVDMLLIYPVAPIRKKLQIKYFLLSGIISYSGGLTNFIPCFRIDIYPYGVYLVPIYIILLTYAIIRYRFLDVETVIHKTILWISTIILLLFPSAVLGVVLKRLLSSEASILVNLCLMGVYVSFSILFYNHFRPRIDYFFRRRKYDYQTILGKVAEKIASTINIEDLTRQFLTEVCETMYLRNGLLYVLSKDESRYSLIGRRWHKEIGGVEQQITTEIYTEKDKFNLLESQKEILCSVPLCQWLIEHQDILEKEQLEMDPQYQPIKQEAARFFQDQDLELIIPLIFENKVTAILGLGKKENLRAYIVKDLQLLKKLGQEVGVTVYNALHHEDIVEKERLDEEMRMGREIQTALLPHEIPQVRNLNIRGFMQPAKEIGGDYYDFITLPDKDNLAIVIGDVSGKGVSAGLIMSLTKATIHALSEEGFSPREILLRTNQFLNKHIGGQKFMTLLYLLWQSQNKTLTYSSAGHEHILLYRHKAKIFEAIQSGGFMLGMIPNIEQFLEEKQISLGPDDKILLYTDGVTEAENQNGVRFGLDRLKEVFQKYSQKPAQELMQSVKDEVYSFIGTHPQYDDITLVVMEAI